MRNATILLRAEKFAVTNLVSARLTLRSFTTQFHHPEEVEISNFYGWPKMQLRAGIGSRYTRVPMIVLTQHRFAKLPSIVAVRGVQDVLPGMAKAMR